MDISQSLLQLLPLKPVTAKLQSMKWGESGNLRSQEGPVNRRPKMSVKLGTNLMTHLSSEEGRRKKEAERRANEVRYEQLWEGSTDFQEREAIILLESDGHYRFEAFEYLIHYPHIYVGENYSLDFEYFSPSNSRRGLNRRLAWGHCNRRKSETNKGCTKIQCSHG